MVLESSLPGIGAINIKMFQWKKQVSINSIKTMGIPLVIDNKILNQG